MERKRTAASGSIMKSISKINEKYLAKTRTKLVTDAKTARELIEKWDAEKKGKVDRARKNFPSTKIVIDEKFLRFVFMMALLAATDEEIARALGISLGHFGVLKNKNASLLEVLKEGKERADAKIAHSLFHAGVGYSHPDEVILTNRVKEFDEFGRVRKEYTEPLRVQTTKHYPPNVKAALRWLAVRRPEMWSEKAMIFNQHVNTINTFSLQGLSEQELLLMQKLGIKDISPALSEHTEDAEYIDDETENETYE